MVKSLRLNLGCEKEILDGWTNLDFAEPKADINWDLNSYPYPFEDNQFEEVLASAILEHVNDFYRTMIELHRISKPGGKIYILLPHASEIINTYGEVEHKRGFVSSTFGDAWANKELYSLFRVIKKRIVYTRCNYTFLNHVINPIVNLFPRMYERVFSGILPCAIMVFILEVRKDKEFQDARKKEIEQLKPLDNLKFIKEI